MKIAIWYLAWLIFVLEAGSRILVLQPEVSGFNRIYFTPLIVDRSLHAPTGVSRTPIFQQRILWISDPDHFEYEQTLNAYGFRGPTFPIDKPVNRRRVVFIGDSFMEGFGTDDEHTIPKIVERDSGGKIEGINLGVGATGLDEYTEIASVSAPLLKPDVVVVAIYQNDFPARGYTAADLSAIPQPVRVSNWRSRFLAIVEHLKNHTPMPTRFHQGRYAFFRPVPDATNPLSGKTLAEVKAHTQAADPLISAAFQGRFNPYQLGVARLTENAMTIDLNERNGAIEYLRAIKTVTDSVGAKLLVIYIPLHVTVSDYYYPFWNELGQPFQVKSLTGPEFRKQQIHLQACAKELGFEFLDTTPRIQQLESAGTHLYHPYDSHMTAQGYGVVANLIWGVLGP